MVSASSTPRQSTPYSADTVFKFRGVSRPRIEQGRCPVRNWALECDCKPYIDILTRGRWNAIGRLIRKGEVACDRVGRFHNTPVFCRCQTVAMDDDGLPVATWEPGDEIPGFEGQA